MPAPRSRRALTLLGAVLLARNPVPLAAQDGTWALTNARIETVTRGVIDKGTIVIRDGLIAAVGANVQIPADARVVDFGSHTVYPGLIDLTSTMGLPATPTPTGGGGGGGPPAQPTTPAPSGGAAQPQYVGLEPDRVVANELRLAAADFRGVRDAGITAVLVAPSRGAFRGLSALVPLGDSGTRRAVIRSPVALHVGFQGVPQQYPSNLLGVIAYERQSFHDARRHATILDRYRAAPRGMQRPEHDPRLDALVPVVRGTLPAFFDASNENDIRRAVRIAKEFDLKLTVVGATEGFRALDALGGRSAVVSVNFPRAPQVTGWSYAATHRRPPNDSAAADSAARKLIEGNAAALHKAGVRFALASGGARPADFLANVRKAIAAGLPRDAALQALTIRPAEIAGVGDALGSVEVGKIANLVVAEGDILGDSAKVRAVFVDGERYEVIAPAAPSAAGGRTVARGGRAAGRDTSARQQAGAGAGAAAVQVTGTWTVVVTSQRGPTTSTLTLTQDGTALSGTMQSEQGTFQITNGRVSGKTVGWTVAMPVGGRSVNVTFQGEAEADRMSGSVAFGDAGSASFTAERRSP